MESDGFVPPPKKIAVEEHEETKQSVLRFLHNLRQSLTEKVDVATQTDVEEITNEEVEAPPPCALHPAYTRPACEKAVPAPIAVPQSSQEMKLMFSKWQDAYVKWFRYMFGVEVTSFDDDDDEEVEEEDVEDEDDDDNAEKTALGGGGIVSPSTSSEQLPMTPITGLEAPTREESIVYGNTGRPLVQVSPGEEFIPLNVAHLLPMRKREHSPIHLFKPAMHSVLVGPNTSSSTTIVDPYVILATLAQITLQQQQPSPPTRLPIIVRPGMALTNKFRGGPKPVMTPWGPLLRYGNYGIYHRNPLDRTTREGGNAMELPSSGMPLLEPTFGHGCVTEAWTPPPQPPPYIHLPKQTMICKLQVPLQSKKSELERHLTEQPMHHRFNINYVNALERVIMSSVSLPVRYLFSTISRLPASEKQWYFSRSAEPTVAPLSPFPLLAPCTFDFDAIPSEVCNMFLCDCLIGDVLIVQTIADWKKRARECAAREAFRVLSQPCFIVGSLRSWYGNQFMVVCHTSQADSLPLLPPFLSDPNEPLQKKDMGINEANKIETMEVINPLSWDEFWLYTGVEGRVQELQMLPSLSNAAVLEWIGRSAEFSRMSVTYEMTVLSDGQFQCSAVVDKDAVVQATAFSIIQARWLAARALLGRLTVEVPIVGFADSDKVSPEDVFASHSWGGVVGLAESLSLLSLVQTAERDSYDDRKARVDDWLVAEMSLLPKNFPVSWSWLRNFLSRYAESSCVATLCVEPDLVSTQQWPMIVAECAQWGLITVTISNKLFIAKRIPLPRLKKTLLKNGRCRNFILVTPQPAAAPDSIGDFLSRYELYDCIEDDAGPLESGSWQQAAGQNCATIKDNTQLDDSCYEKAEPPHETRNIYNPIEILDDLPKELIPGIDF